jgi:hypothetical protein
MVTAHAGTQMQISYYLLQKTRWSSASEISGRSNTNNTDSDTSNQDSKSKRRETEAIKGFLAELRASLLAHGEDRRLTDLLPGFEKLIEEDDTAYYRSAQAKAKVTAPSKSKERGRKPRQEEYGTAEVKVNAYNHPEANTSH